MFKSFNIHSNDGIFILSALIDKDNKYTMPTLEKFVYDGINIFIADNELWINNLHHILFHYISLEKLLNDKDLVCNQFNIWFNNDTNKTTDEKYLDNIYFTWDQMEDLYEILTEAKTLNIL